MHITCVQNVTVLALAVPEILLGASKFKVDFVTLTTPFLRVICHVKNVNVKSYRFITACKAHN